MMDHMENFGWGMGFGGLFMLLFWGLIILGIAVLIKSLWPNNNTQQKTALEILQARYARGEIDREEYLQKKTDLESK